MSENEELLAALGEVSFELLKVKKENAALREELSALQTFVMDAARNGKPLSIVPEEAVKVVAEPSAEVITDTPAEETT